tara:strand:- start:941 stop:1228 length:288 start_codon:yes stop_codon:yes gene_type:complete
MECEIINLQEYREALEKKEREEIEILAEKVREAIKDFAEDPYEPMFMIHNWNTPELDANLLYNTASYSYQDFSYLYEDGEKCPHCKSQSQDNESE